MKYYAHSPKDGIDAQTYAVHIRGVCLIADQFAKEVEAFAAKDGTLFERLVDKVAEYHDLGKLDPENQKVLSGAVPAKSLPVNHVDAGAAFWLEEQHFSAFSAAVTQAHHIGYPNFTVEQNKGDHIFRDVDIADDVNTALPSYEAVHAELLGKRQYDNTSEAISGDPSVFLRMLLSCIADADHFDTARHYGKYPKVETRIPLRADDRLAHLDQCVAKLQQVADKSERNNLRNEMYQSCRDAKITAGICSCDSPVGSGKTTAVMAHLLAQAQKRGLRRIFVVLPFTNIIQQSVKTYRDMLALPGEKPEDIVAELHHRADFESEDARHLTALWRAPIIVTTAVAFFETLASNSTSTMRRLHELPGSAIFVDESHAALPANLLPIAWKWIRIFSNEWSCYWVMASGSLSRFWTIKDIAEDFVSTDIPELVDDRIREKLSSYEKNRINYQCDLRPKNTDELSDWVTSFSGPRLVILNTVQSAAVLADCIAQKFDRSKVEHLSTSLMPNDREATLEHIKARLSDPSDTDWTLVATSCVEAGVDLSFKTGFHELSSLSSLLQAAGRINREGIVENAEMWTFRIEEDGMLKLNPGLKQAGEVLKGYIEDGILISPTLTTRSISDEIALYGMNGKHRELVKNENVQNFPGVEHDFKVINSDTRLVVVDRVIANQLKYGIADWHELQKCSIQVAKYRLDELRTPRILDDIYYWNLEYDRFLGYMAGIIKHKRFSGEALIV